MTLDAEIVSYVRVGRGMVKVTKYENEQPKSPSDTISVLSRSSSGRSASRPTRGWLRPLAKGSTKRTPSAHRHRSRSRSSARSLHAIHRTSGYMRSEHDVLSSERPAGDATTSGRREPQGGLPLDSLPVPGSIRPGELPCDNYPKPTPRLSIERGRRRALYISPPLGTSSTQAASHPSPSTLSWATESEIDPAADAEMWAHITRLEDELVSRFGRGAVPQFSSLRTEKSSTPSTTTATKGKRDLSPALPDELIAALQRSPPSSEKLKQRSFEPIHLAEPPRRVHRAKSSPTLVFPLPPATIPNWAAQAPQGFIPSYATMRAKAGPPPPFAPPPDFPPPPPPSRSTRPKAPATTEDAKALEELYRVLVERTANSRRGIGKPVDRSTLRPEDTRRLKDLELGSREASRSRPFGTSKEDLPEGSRTPSVRAAGNMTFC